MPEGDSIHNLARKIAPLLLDREVTAFSARRISDVAARTIVGHTIIAVEARGKNLLIRFDDGRMLHIHLRMEGRVFIERPRSTFWRAPVMPPDMRLAVRGGAIVGKRLPVCRLLTAVQEKRLPDLASLGPDLVRSDWDEDEALRRLQGLTDREIADAILVQRAAAGIGNVYKSEVLFLEKVDPRTPVAEVDVEKLRSILRRASVLLRRNIDNSGARITRESLGGARLWVYGRGRKPCLRCGRTIERFMQGPPPGRSTYWCPGCQSRAAAA